MADNLTAGNPRAHAVRVYYFGTSTIYEGMPVCYDNSTTNWFGGSVADTGEVTAIATTAEGSQNEGKYIRVENVNADNCGMFAGVVKKGGWCGTTGPSALDIYIPNGAVVPVRTDQNCLIDQTILALTTAQQELGAPLETDGRPVAIARETIDRGTAGLVLAELCPYKFVYQDSGGTALSVDDASTTTATLINTMQIDFLGSSVYQKVLYAKGTLSGGGSCIYGMFKFRTVIDSIMTRSAHCLCAQIHIKDSGTLSDVGEFASAAIYATLETDVESTAPTMSGGSLAALYIGYYVDESVAAPARAYPFWFNNTNGRYWDGLLHCQALGDIGDYVAVGGAPTIAALSLMIPIEVAGTDYYLIATTDAATS